MSGESPILSFPEWQARVAAHRSRANQWTAPARKRRGSRQVDPVKDFLFTYYRLPFSKLEQWHPPFGAILVDGDRSFPWLDKAPYRATGSHRSQDPSFLSTKEITRLDWIRKLLVATRNRRPIPNCHGIHEWAMVYKGDQVRHSTTTPLRLPQTEIDALVESRPIQCSHFDAFRFFQADAQPMNRLQPSLMEREQFEQPACIHANMDLYKWAFKAMPWVGSELLLDCFELAIKLRDLDMRASPYDLSAQGLEPVRIETPEGRNQYENEQQSLASLSAPIRSEIIRTLDHLLSHLPLSESKAEDESCVD